MWLRSAPIDSLVCRTLPKNGRRQRNLRMTGLIGEPYSPKDLCPLFVGAIESTFRSIEEARDAYGAAMSLNCLDHAGLHGFIGRAGLANPHESVDIWELLHIDCGIMRRQSYGTGMYGQGNQDAGQR